MWLVNDFKIAASAILDSRKLHFMSHDLRWHAILLHIAKIAEIGRSIAEVCRKTISKMATVRHLEFQKFNF